MCDQVTGDENVRILPEELSNGVFSTGARLAGNYCFLRVWSNVYRVG